MNVNKDWYDNIAIENGILDIPNEQINKERTKIGFGKYGIVYKTTSSLIEGDVAIKEIYIRNQECIENFINEVRVHSLSRHRRIIQIYGISRNVKKNLYYIVMEYANNGTLRDFLSKNNPVDLKERIRLAIQISEGISYLHNKLYISHRDLHAKNILIKNGNIKISDFGNSKCFINDQKNFESHNVLDNSPFTFYKVSDIHSLGVILLELSNCRKTSHKELISKRCLKKDCLEIHEKSGMTSNLQLKPLEPVYLNTDKKSYIRAIQSPVF